MTENSTLALKKYTNYWKKLRTNRVNLKKKKMKYGS